MGKWSEAGVKCWIPKASELEVGQITHFHNVDCAAYEKRIAELTAEVARVKAESLRVVAHGAKMQLDELWCDEYLIACKGRVYIREYDTDNFVELSDGPCLDVHEDTIVQPVRLERWEEQG